MVKYRRNSVYPRLSGQLGLGLTYNRHISLSLMSPAPESRLFHMDVTASRAPLMFWG